MSLARAFLALPVDSEMRSRIAATSAGLKGRLQGVRWVSEAGLHLTLRFLGRASPDGLARLHEPLQRAAADCPVCEARLAELGTFPERGAPRVLWLGVSFPPSILELQAACECAAAASGFPPEARPFRPHLTLGRWRERASRPALPPVDLGATELESLVLFRSDLKPTGAVYSPLATFPLKR